MCVCVHYATILARKVVMECGESKNAIKVNSINGGRLQMTLD